GEYCQELKDVLKGTKAKDGIAAAPGIVQARLVPPEVRVYQIGDLMFAFTIAANALDYRTTSDCRIDRMSKIPRAIQKGLARLSREMGLTFLAADFKTCPRTGELLFLEVNSGPMFSAFDYACGGCLTKAIARFLG